MKTKLDIYSSENLKYFFSSLDSFFDINLKNYENLYELDDKKNLSIVFVDDYKENSLVLLKEISKNENFMFVCADYPILHKLELEKNSCLISPFSLNKLIDFINNFVNKRKYTFNEIQLHNQTFFNMKTKNHISLTYAENLIVLKLFKEKKIKKKLLERDVLEIKHELNTSSMESHLNRIRKKLKKIKSNLSIYTRDNEVFIGLANPDK